MSLRQSFSAAILSMTCLSETYVKKGILLGLDHTHLEKILQPRGFYETPDQWLARLQATTVIGFFGYSEAFDGLGRLEGYKAELKAFIQHTKKQQYSGKSAPKIAIVSPAALEDLSAERDYPDGSKANPLLKAYTQAMAEVCKAEGVLFFDAFSTTQGFYDSSEKYLTSNGNNLNASVKLKPRMTIL